MDLEQCFREFEAYYERQNYGFAADSIMLAIEAMPGSAFRYFMARASGALARTLGNTGRGDEVVRVLDGLLPHHPYMHLLVDEDDPALIGRLIELRNSHISKGLPSVAIVTQGKSGSFPVANIFNSGYNLPSFAYSLGVLSVIDSFARDFARGGACYSTHLEPTPINIERLKAAGIEKIIVHVRDPRQSMVSMAHHIMRYPEQVPGLVARAALVHSMQDRMDLMYEFYCSRVRWIRNWVNAESQLDILFSTFEDFVQDRTAFTQRYLSFYGHEEHFCWQWAMDAGGDQHFRLGRTDEWREVIPPDQAEFLTSFIPKAIFDRFGWSP